MTTHATHETPVHRAPPARADAVSPTTGTARSIEPFFTIITAAYRGAAFLPTLHAQLKAIAPHSPPFEWIVVDDASADDGATVAAMRAIEADLSLPVTCLYLDRNHYGAMSTRIASQAARADWLVILDQDDWLTADALWIYQRGIDAHGERPDFAGVCGRCVDSHGRFIGTPLPEGSLFASELEIRHRHRIRGEMLQCTRTALIRQHFASMRPGHTNGFVWRRIARDHRYLYVNDVVRHYDTENPNSWMHQRTIKYPATLYAEMAEYLEMALPYVGSDPLEVMRIAVHCRRFRVHARRCGSDAPPPASLGARLAMAAVAPVALALAALDIARKRVRCAG
jgi:glycosyltransferase involved in cell wall biosynthesis